MNRLDQRLNQAAHETRMAIQPRPVDQPTAMRTRSRNRTLLTAVASAAAVALAFASVALLAPTDTEPAVGSQQHTSTTSTPTPDGADGAVVAPAVGESFDSWTGNMWDDSLNVNDHIISVRARSLGADGWFEATSSNVEHLIDESLETLWIGAAQEAGDPALQESKAWIEITFDTPISIVGVVVAPSLDPAEYEAHHWIRMVTVENETVTLNEASQWLDDISAIQMIPIRVSPNGTTTLTLDVEGLYAADSADGLGELAIAELVVQGQLLDSMDFPDRLNDELASGTATYNPLNPDYDPIHTMRPTAFTGPEEPWIGDPTFEGQNQLIASFIEPKSVTSVTYFPHQSTTEFLRHQRIRNVEIRNADGVLAEVEFADSQKPQIVEIPLQPNTTTDLTFVIKSVYQAEPVGTLPAVNAPAIGNFTIWGLGSDTP